MALLNPWIGYIDRSYTQIKNTVLALFPLRVPEMTDHTESNPFVRMLSVWAGVAEMLGYYIDNTAKEAFLYTATLWKSGVAQAKDRDYRIKSVIPALVDLRFYVDDPAPSNIVVPAGTETQTASGIIFVTTAPGTILAGTNQILIPASNIIPVTGEILGVTNALPNQIFVLGEDVVDKQVEITIGGDVYLFAESFGLVNYNEKRFTLSVNENRESYIQLGDGINGVVPTPNLSVVANYFVSSGEAGNVGPGTVNIVVSSVTVPAGVELKVKNSQRAAGGYDIESLADLKKKIPLAVSTYGRAVTDQDYVDIALLANGVAQAAQNFRCGKTVPVYIVPTGGGTASQTLLKQVEMWFENKRMTTTKVDVLAAGVIEVVIEADVTALPNYFNATVETEVENNLIAYGSVDNQEIGGAVYLGDIYQTIENTIGVKHSVVKILTLKPAAIGQAIDTALIWTREILSNAVGTVEWRVKVISTTAYQLYRAGIFVGTFNFGTEYTVEELKFTIEYDSSYVVDDTWVFKTYSVTNTIELTEFSIPLIFIENLKINVTGGI